LQELPGPRGTNGEARVSKRKSIVLHEENTRKKQTYKKINNFQKMTVGIGTD
jgi:hypothetical protein